MSLNLQVELGPRSYSIQMGSGLLDRLGDCCAQLGRTGTALVVTDTNVGPLYGERAKASLTRSGWTVHSMAVPAGEASKDQSTLFSLYKGALAAKLDRSALIVALGGGVVGDLAGFFAATYLRGVALAQVPTSLLAMVDSSVGGKTGINLPEGKNLVGAFYQPALVVADTATLSTLPAREYAAGMAEVVKYGVIRDADFFQRLEKDAARLVHPDADGLPGTIAACCAAKADVVRSDETEQGLRAILNFGHTLGHAIERVAGYGTFLHGEAVSIGMVYAALLSARLRGLPITDVLRIRDLLQALRAPVARPDVSWPALCEAMTLDKKSAGARPRFVLADRIGAAVWGCEASDEAMEETWRDFGSLASGGGATCRP